MEKRAFTVLANDYRSSVPGSGASVKGGPARFSIELREHLVRRGVRWIGAMHDTTAGTPPTSLAHRGRGWSVHAVNAGKVRLEAIRDDAPKTLAGARRWAADDIAAAAALIDETSPDVVFLNGYSTFAWALLEAAVSRKVPVAIQHAGILAVEVRQYAEMFGPRGRALCYAMERETARSARANIFLNDFSREAFSRVLRLKEEARGAAVIPLPHAGWKFPKGPIAPKKREERIIGVVARWDRIKNMDAVLAFAEEVRRRGLPWKVRAVTSIPETPARAEFKARFRAEVEVVPPMDRDALRSFYEGCDAMLLPSHFDVSPTVVMEAAAAGVPTVISPNVGWVSEYAASGMADWVVDFSRPAKAIDLLSRQFARNAWPELARFAKKTAARHDPKKVYAAYLALFRRLAKEAKQKAATRKR